MEFCQKCKGIIIVKDGKAVCAACGAKTGKKPKMEVSEKVKKHDSIAVVKEGDDNIYPIVDMECPECKHKKCYFWTVQTRSSDESETKFYKCMKRSHTWRKYR